MVDEDVPRIPTSETGLSAPLTDLGGTVEAKTAESGFDLLPAERSELPPQFRGKLLRVMNGELFVVDPGSPPPSPSA